MTKKRYTARYRFEDGDWNVEVDEIPQVHTFAKTLAKAQAHTRDALALWLQVEDARPSTSRSATKGSPKTSWTSWPERMRLGLKQASYQTALSS